MHHQFDAGFHTRGNFVIATIIVITGHANSSIYSLYAHKLEEHSLIRSHNSNIGLEMFSSEDSVKSQREFLVVQWVILVTMITNCYCNYNFCSCVKSLNNTSPTIGVCVLIMHEGQAFKYIP